MELFAQRRHRLLDRIGGVAVIGSTPVSYRNNDVEHLWRQHSDLFYFTGFEEPESVLLLSTVHPEHRAVMFVRPKDPEREVWDGARVGVEGAKALLGVDAVYSIDELDDRLGDYFKGAPRVYYELGQQPELDATVMTAIGKARGRGRTPAAWPTAIEHPEGYWHEMRLIKDEAELAHMRRAAEITVRAHQAAMAATAPGTYEYDIEALLSHDFRRAGATRVAYASIVGSGPNATVLHYHANERRMGAGELLLIDAGCEYNYYAADITRTFPVDGHFSAPQRRVYQAVLDAQLDAIEHTGPNTTVKAIHERCVERLVAGMLELGLLEGDAEAAIESEAYKRYYMHRTSHWLGMDVHDVGAYFVGGQARELVPGMVLTIEPGIYVAEDDEQAPAELRGIGVRIEDDLLVTASGCEVLTAGAPKQIDDVERACGR